MLIVLIPKPTFKVNAKAAVLLHPTINPKELPFKCRGVLSDHRIMAWAVFSSLDKNFTY